jgi:hypothetical protein
MSQNLLTQEQIGTLLGVSGEQVEEHRKHRRLTYPVVQMFAAAPPGQLPELNEFQRVRCRDISQSGIAFLWEGAPCFTEVVLALGPRPEVIVVRGRVVRKEPLNDGSGWYLVGCAFTERVRLPE